MTVKEFVDSLKDAPFINDKTELKMRIYDQEEMRYIIVEIAGLYINLESNLIAIGEGGDLDE